MIRHRLPGITDLDLLAASGHTFVYRIAPGQEANARAFIWCAMLREDLTPAEAALLVKGTAQIEQPAAGPRALNPPAGSREWRRALAAVRGLVSRAIDGIGAWLGKEETCEMGGSSK